MPRLMQKDIKIVVNVFGGAPGGRKGEGIVFEGETSEKMALDYAGVQGTIVADYISLTSTSAVHHQIARLDVPTHIRLDDILEILSYFPEGMFLSDHPHATRYITVLAFDFSQNVAIDEESSGGESTCDLGSGVVSLEAFRNNHPSTN